jgi:thiamine-monophosphate kinase
MLRDGTQGAASEDACVERYLRPAPRVRLGLLLGRNRAATACMDLSDGLADGVQQVARLSGVALTGGDDYELIFTVRPRLRSRLRTVTRHADTPITRIGVCTPGSQVLLHREDGDIPMPRGYGHFR